MGALVPIAVKFSRNFYEHFGELTDELVDWFNAVDTAYQNQLREVNELNWERFKAELNATRTELRTEMRAMAAELRGEMQAMEARLRGEMQAGFAQVRLEMEQLRSSVLKWMFIYWTGTMVSLAAFIYTMMFRR